MGNGHSKLPGRRKKEKSISTPIDPVTATTVVPTNNDLQNDVQPNDPQSELQSKRLNFDLAEDPNYQRKLDAIDYSIEVPDLFERLSEVIALVVPDALGVALKTITAILGRLKVRSESVFTCGHSLISLVRKWSKTSKRGRIC